MPVTVLRDLVELCLLFLAAKPSHVRVDWTGYVPLHCPTICGHQMRGQSFLSGAAISHRAAVGGGTFLGGAKPLGLDI
jgi:hypothetical protein